MRTFFNLLLLSSFLLAPVQASDKRDSTYRREYQHDAAAYPSKKRPLSPSPHEGQPPKKKFKASSENDHQRLVESLKKAEKARDSFEKMFSNRSLEIFNTQEENKRLVEEIQKIKERDTLLQNQSDALQKNLTEKNNSYNELLKKHEAVEKEKETLRREVEEKERELEKKETAFRELEETYKNFKTQQSGIHTQIIALLKSPTPHSPQEPSRENVVENTHNMDQQQRSSVPAFTFAEGPSIKSSDIFTLPPSSPTSRPLSLDKSTPPTTKSVPAFTFSQGTSIKPSDTFTPRPSSSTSRPLSLDKSTPPTTKDDQGDNSLLILKLPPRRSPSSSSSASSPRIYTPKSPTKDKSGLQINLRSIDHNTFLTYLTNIEKTTSLEIANRLRQKKENIENFKFPNKGILPLSHITSININGKFSGLKNILTATVLPKIENIQCYVFSHFPTTLFQTGNWKDMKDLTSLTLTKVSLAQSKDRQLKDLLNDFFSHFDLGLPQSLTTLTVTFKDNFEKNFNESMKRVDNTYDLTPYKGSLQKVIQNKPNLATFTVSGIDILDALKKTEKRL